MQRTALESALIPVTAYILVACVECYRRYPGDDRRRSRPRAARGARATRVTSSRRRSTTCTCGRCRTSRLSAARCSRGAGMLDAEQDVADAWRRCFDFWDRAACAYRFDDGTHQAWDADGVATPYRADVDEIVAGVPADRDDDARGAHRRA